MSLRVSPPPVSDPLDWSCGDVQKWLLWTEHLYKLPQLSTMFQQLSGRDLCSMAEADFKHSSQFGDVLYAHLDIWRSGKNINNCGKILYREDIRKSVRQIQDLA